MNYELVADPAVEGNFFLKGATGHFYNSFPFQVATEVQSGMEIAYADGALAASLIGAKVTGAMVDAVVESNAREAIKTLDLIVELVKAGHAESIIGAVNATKANFEEYLKTKAAREAGPKSNQE